MDAMDAMFMISNFKYTFKSANSTDGNQRIDGRYLDSIRENFGIVSGVNQRQTLRRKKTDSRR
jgi:hypothetical protein